MSLQLPRGLAFSGSAGGLVVALLALCGVGMVDTDAVVETGFRSALNGVTPSIRTGSSVVALSEDEWLGKALPEFATPVHWVRQVAVGDRLDVRVGGVDRRFEVVDVRPVRMGSDASEGSQRGNDVDIMLARCRDVDNPSSEPVQLVLDGTGATVLVTSVGGGETL